MLKRLVMLARRVLVRVYLSLPDKTRLKIADSKAKSWAGIEDKDGRHEEPMKETTFDTSRMPGAGSAPRWKKEEWQKKEKKP